MSTTPVFILKSAGNSERLTYSETSKLCSADKLNAMIEEALKYVDSRRGSAKEFELNARETLVITFNDRL